MEIDHALVERLVAAQFPQYAGLPVARVEPGGIDNRTFRIGSDLLARLPSAEGYVLAVEKEQRWLPELANKLDSAIPVPVGLGAPGEGYSWPWSLYRWLPGVDVLHVDKLDRTALASSLGGFVTALRNIDGSKGPLAGAHSFYRGASLMNYDKETRSVLRTPDEAQVWEAAIASTWTGPRTWFHGDIAPGNLLIEDGQLTAVIDWGTSGVGDPACDLVIAWTFFDEIERQVFASGAGLDADTWARARGWALWKALITGDAASDRVVHEILNDPVVPRR
jgi:aminoglycoside phosphotransferase (APT) family kinase protein